MTATGLFVSVPVASFRVPHAREYLETLPCPPPATVYGMLLSLAGETDRRTHIGAEIAVGMLSHPRVSTVLRTMWRVKSAKAPLGLGGNKRPDYQELLTDVRLAVWIRRGGAEAAVPTLVGQVLAALGDGEKPRRFGGLALGESTHLVDEIRPLRTGDLAMGVDLLCREERGDLALPVWVDHVGSAGTRWGQYGLERLGEGESLPEEAWTAIEPPD